MAGEEREAVRRREWRERVAGGGRRMDRHVRAMGGREEGWPTRPNSLPQAHPGPRLTSTSGSAPHPPPRRSGAEDWDGTCNAVTRGTDGAEETSQLPQQGPATDCPTALGRYMYLQILQASPTTVSAGCLTCNVEPVPRLQSRRKLQGAEFPT